jgi:Flp pilus assembly protein TadG
MMAWLRKLWRARKAVVALEFGLVALPFLAMLLAVVQVSFALYVQSVLNYAALESGRQVQIGAVPSNTTPSVFLNTIVCPNLSGLLACNAITIDLESVNDYYTCGNVTLNIPAAGVSQSKMNFSTGSPGSLMFLRIMYQAPIYSTLWFTGASTQYIQATAAFSNESATILSSTPAGGC